MSRNIGSIRCVGRELVTVDFDVGEEKQMLICKFFLVKMDIFRVLSRGANINKNQNKKYINVTKENNEVDKKLDVEISKELDFFGTKSDDEQEPLVLEPTEADVTLSNFDEADFTEKEAAVFRKQNHIKFTGNDVPLPVKSFNNLTSQYLIGEQFSSNLIDCGFINPTPIQSECISVVLDRRDLIACSPTGSGKTLGYLVPVIVEKLQEKKNTSTLVLGPTKELTQQIFNEAIKLTKDLGVNVKLLSSSLIKNISQGKYDKKIDILIATPLMLIKSGLDQSFDRIVFDEADRLFEGEFLKQMDEILEKNKTGIKMMFSATIPSHVEQLCQLIMNEDHLRVIVGNKQAANVNIEQKLIFCGNEEGKLLEIRNMISRGEFKPPIIIFLQSIIRAKALFHELLYENINLEVIHSEKSTKERQDIIEKFKVGKIWVLICTDVLARGIDFKNINMVINYDVPTNPANYIHRIGRTGRNGRVGHAVTFYTKEDVVHLKSIVNVVKQTGKIEGWMENLGKVTRKEKNGKKKEVKRKKISTVPSVVIHKKKMRKQMIKHSKEVGKAEK